MSLICHLEGFHYPVPHHLSLNRLSTYYAVIYSGTLPPPSPTYCLKYHQSPPNPLTPIFRAVVKGSDSLLRDTNCIYDACYDIPVTNCSNYEASSFLQETGLRGQCMEGGTCLCGGEGERSDELTATIFLTRNPISYRDSLRSSQKVTPELATV